VGVILKYALLAFFFITAAVNARDLDKLYKKADLRIGPQKISAYIADDEEGRAQGLMFIEKMPENVGMIFVFEEERPLSFWMKNTLIPLSIGFFDAKGKLIDIQEMSVANSIMEKQPPSYPSKGPAMFALEMNTGWFSRHKIKVGVKLARLADTPSKLFNEELPKQKSARH